MRWIYPEVRKNTELPSRRAHHTRSLDGSGWGIDCRAGRATSRIDQRRTIHMYQITLRMARINSGLSLEQAAEAAGVTRRTLTRWEQDSSKAHLTSVLDLLRVYGTSMDMYGSAKKKMCSKSYDQILKWW